MSDGCFEQGKEAKQELQAIPLLLEGSSKPPAPFFESGGYYLSINR
jgi:hypothetical protein